MSHALHKLYRPQAINSAITQERTHKKWDVVSTFESAFFRRNMCPDCESLGFFEGPQGGGCINFKCCNPECGSEFNDMGPFGIQRISDKREP